MIYMYVCAHKTNITEVERYIFYIFGKNFEIYSTYFLMEVKVLKVHEELV